MQVKMLSEQNYEVSELNIQNILHQKFCVFDLEATGIQVETERIIQIGAVHMDRSGVNSQKTFNTFVRPAKPIPQEIEILTGIYNDDVEHAPRLNEVYDRFLDFADDYILVTHAGYEFDLPLLQQECIRQGLQFPTHTCIDTKTLFTYLHPEVEDIISTDFLLYYYGLSSDGLQRHDALGDSILIAQIFLEMLRELESRNTESLEIQDPLIVKRFQIPPIAKRSDSRTLPGRFPSLNRQQHTALLSLIVLLLLTAVFTGLLDLLTFRPSWNGGISGNGNPGLILVFVMIPLYAVLLYLMGKISHSYFREQMKKGLYSTGSITFLVIMVGVMGLFAYGYYGHIFRGLGGGPEHSESVIYRWGNWNQYTNTAYINLFTYMLGLLWSIIIGYMAALITRKNVTVE